MDVLPEAPWFTLSIYQRLENWSEVEWATAISSRISIDRLLGSGAVPEEHKQALNDLLRKHFSALVDDPLRGGAPLWQAWDGGLRTNLWNLHYLEDSEWAVSPVNGVNMDEQAKWPRHGPEFSFVRVDLSAPDRTLVESFATWLKKMRAKTQRVGAVTRADMRGWVECHAIPYLDLVQFLKFSEQKVTNARIADLLFPESEVDRVERLRKVTVRASEKILDINTYMSLLAQIGGAKGEPASP